MFGFGLFCFGFGYGFGLDIASGLRSLCAWVVRMWDLLIVLVRIICAWSVDMFYWCSILLVFC